MFTLQNEGLAKTGLLWFLNFICHVFTLVRCSLWVLNVPILNVNIVPIPRWRNRIVVFHIHRKNLSPPNQRNCFVLFLPESKTTKIFVLLLGIVVYFILLLHFTPTIRLVGWFTTFCESLLPRLWFVRSYQDLLLRVLIEFTFTRKMERVLRSFFTFLWVYLRPKNICVPFSFHFVLLTSTASTTSPVSWVVGCICGLMNATMWRNDANSGVCKFGRALTWFYPDLGPTCRCPEGIMLWKKVLFKVERTGLTHN